MSFSSCTKLKGEIGNELRHAIIWEAQSWHVRDSPIDDFTVFYEKLIYARRPNMWFPCGLADTVRFPKVSVLEFGGQ